MNNTDLKEAKKAQRKETGKRMAALSHEYMEDASSQIAAALMKTKEYLEADTIFCYMNFGKEVVTSGIIEDALRRGKKVCIPLCHGKGVMDARYYNEDTKLVPGAYGIMEPSPEEPVAQPEDIDLAIVPCVTCDRQLSRLGHGAGYYDRFFSLFKGCKVALCFEEILVDKVVTEEHDITMDKVISEKYVYEKEYGEYRRWRP